VAFPSAGLGKNFAANEQAEFYSDSGKSNSLATDFCARSDIVIARQLTSLHAAAVIDRDECALRRIAFKNYLRRARVERIGHNFGENGFLD
jgi:hypothetical protein